MPRFCIIDLDPGVDDLQAILIALRCPRIKILAYTICGGNIDTEQGTKNLNNFLYYIGERKYQIYKGLPTSMDGKEIKNDGYFSLFGLCGTQFPDAPLSYIDNNITASEAIIQLAHKYPNCINIICMGPLTNLARAYQLDPTIYNKFKRIYIMGGNRSPKVENNVTKYAEFNSYVDPLAAQIVYQNMKPIKINGFIVIDWLFCHTYDINKQLIQDLSTLETNDDECNAKKIFYHKIYNSTFCTHLQESLRYLTADPFIVIAAGYPHIITGCTFVNFDNVVLEGETKGRTTFTISQLDTTITLINRMDMESVEHIIKDSVEIEEFISDDITL